MKRQPCTNRSQTVERLAKVTPNDDRPTYKTLKLFKNSLGRCQCVWKKGSKRTLRRHPFRWQSWRYHQPAGLLTHFSRFHCRLGQIGQYNTNSLRHWLSIWKCPNRMDWIKLTKNDWLIIILAGCCQKHIGDDGEKSSWISHFDGRIEWTFELHH